MVSKLSTTTYNSTDSALHSNIITASAVPHVRVKVLVVFFLPAFFLLLCFQSPPLWVSPGKMSLLAERVIKEEGRAHRPEHRVRLVQ